MSEKQRAASSGTGWSLGSWEAFLPEGAIVMARQEAFAESSSSSGQEVPLEGDPSSGVLFVGTRLSAEAQSLFRKMLAAVSLNPEQVLCAWLPENDPAASRQDLGARLERQVQDSVLWISLGDSLSDADLSMPHPEAVLKDASLKVAAWDALQKMAARLGLPTRGRT